MSIKKLFFSLVILFLVPAIGISNKAGQKNLNVESTTIYKPVLEQGLESFNRLYITIGNIYSDNGEMTATPKSVTIHGFKKNSNYNKVCRDKPRSKLTTNFSILKVISISGEILYRCFLSRFGIESACKINMGLWVYCGFTPFN